MQEHIPDAQVVDWLMTLGITSLCQWDLLVFLHRHPSCLVGADDLAHLLGYATESVVAAMDALESLGLLGRSRISHGACLYQFTVPSETPDGPRGLAFARLLALASHRAGRLRLSVQLRGGKPCSEAELHAAGCQRFGARQVLQLAGPQSAPNRDRKEIPWLKAI